MTDFYLQEIILLLREQIKLQGGDGGLVPTAQQLLVHQANQKKALSDKTSEEARTALKAKRSKKV